MSTLLVILGILFLALFVIVPLIERFAKPYDEQQLGKITRWILPALLVLMVLQAVRYFF